MLERLAYLNTGTFGPLPQRAADLVVRWQERVLVEGRSSLALWEESKALRSELRQALANAIGADSASLALTTSTTEGCDVVLAGLQLGPEDEVVTTDQEHPGLLGALRVSPAQVRVARLQDRPASEALAVIEAELSGRTRLVALSHVAWTTGAVLPVARARRPRLPAPGGRCPIRGGDPRRRPLPGLRLLHRVRPEMAPGPGYDRSALRPPGSGGGARPAAPSYLSWEDTVALVPWPDARRFESVWIGPGPLAGLLASIRFAEELGEERFARAREIAEACRKLCEAKAEMITEPGQATLVSFRPRGDAAEIVSTLAEQGVVVRDLPGLGWIRASCGFWTSPDDLERLAAGL